MKPVRFSQHALEKFDILSRHGFVATQEAVIETVLSPDKIEGEHYPRIAQRRITEHTVLRVVYTEDDSGFFVITFYPGERRRYED